MSSSSPADRPRARLHVPEPVSRRDGAGAFTGFVAPVAGALSRPPIDAAPEDIRAHAFEIVRVLDDAGVARGPWADPAPPADELREGLRDMMRLRAFDARMLLAQRQGKTSFYVQALGEEAVACAARRAQEPGDMNFPTYRQQGLLIAGGYPIVDMMRQIFSNAKDPLHGRQLPVLYSARSHGFFSVSGNLATQFVQAVGWAMGAAIDGSDRIAIGWIGDGATAEPDFHAALVFASTYRPPVVLNVVDNQWAISTFQGMARGASATFAARARGYGLAALRVDGNDYVAVRAVQSWACARARAGHGPTFVEHVTYRAGAHSTSDDPSAYRPKDEPGAWPLGDPIERLSRHLIGVGAWSEARQAQAQAEVEAEVLAAQREAERDGTLQGGSRPPARDMFADVYAETPPHLERQRREAEAFAQREA